MTKNFWFIQFIFFSIKKKYKIEIYYYRFVSFFSSKLRVLKDKFCSYWGQRIIIDSSTCYLRQSLPFFFFFLKTIRWNRFVNVHQPNLKPSSSYPWHTKRPKTLSIYGLCIHKSHYISDLNTDRERATRLCVYLQSQGREYISKMKLWKSR